MASVIASLQTDQYTKNRRFWKPKRSIPKEAASLIGARFVPISGGEDASCGLMPRMMQAVQNCYTRGMDAISFEKSQKEVVMIWREGEETHRLPLGFGEAIVTRERFGNTEYILTNRCRMGVDEDGRQVLIGQVDFSETPFKRFFRLYWKDGYGELKMDEKPGVAFLMSFASVMGEELFSIPLIGSTLSKINPEMVIGLLDTVFKPTINMKKILDK